MAQLNDDDRLAVDLVLASRIARHPRDGNGAEADAGEHSCSAPEHLRERIACVEQLLDLLKLLPAPPPPPDLVAKTMQFIESSRIRPSSRFSENDRIPPGVFPHL